MLIPGSDIIKSSHSQTEIHACVGARTPDGRTVEVKDTKDLTITGFAVSSAAWENFLTSVR